MLRLELVNISKQYPAVKANDSVNLRVEPGRSADVCVWDWAAEPVAARRMAAAQALHERVFAWMTMADDRNLVAAFVAGVPRAGHAVTAAGTLRPPRA